MGPIRLSRGSGFGPDWKEGGTRVENRGPTIVKSAIQKGGTKVIKIVWIGFRLYQS